MMASAVKVAQKREPCIDSSVILRWLCLLYGVQPEKSRATKTGASM